MRNLIRLLASCLTVLMLISQCTAAEKPVSSDELSHKSARLFPIEPYPEGKNTVSKPWLSDHELLHFAHNGKLYRFDIQSHSDIPLNALSHRIFKSHCKYVKISAVPNGPWVIWHGFESNTIFAATLDGRRLIGWTGHFRDCEPCWLSDGRHWLAIPYRFAVTGHFAVLHEYNVDVHSQDMIFKEDPDVALSFRGNIMCGDDIVTGPPAQTDIPELDNYDLMLLRWRLGRPTPIDTLHIKLPMPPTQIAVSPRFDRLACMYFGSERGKPNTDLWIGNIDGTHMRKIGITHDVFQDHAWFGQTELRDWSPDGKYLSFVYEGALWLLPTT